MLLALAIHSLST